MNDLSVLEELQKDVPEVPTKPHPRRVIDAAEPFHILCEEAWDAIVEFNDTDTPSRVCVRGDTLVRMGEHELIEFTVDSLREQLSKVASFMRTRETDEGPMITELSPPVDVCRALMARDGSEYPGVPHIDKVVDVPILDKDSEIVENRGAKVDSTVYYKPDPKLEKQIRIAPVDGPADLESAVDFLLEDLLGDFEFAEPSSQSHALSLLLLPFVREIIPGPTPMHVIVAPDIGSGKTLLGQAALMPGCGDVPATSTSGDDEEWRKRITSELMGGHPAILLDNLAGKLDSSSLANALTTGIWRDRQLGSNTQVTLPVRNVWVVTGNNVALTPEQIRRSVPIFLEPGDVRPSDRPASSYRHPDLLRWARENRAGLASSALTIVQHWLEGPVEWTEGGWIFHRSGGDPLQSQKTLGSFEGWARTMGGILDSIGVEGFLENRDRLSEESDPETDEKHALYEAWHGLGIEPVTSKEFITLLRYGGQLADYAPVGLLEGKQPEKIITYWLRDNKGTRAGGYQLVKMDERPTRWYVRKNEPVRGRQ